MSTETVAATIFAMLVIAISIDFMWRG